MAYFKQIHGQVVGVVYYAVAVFFAEEGIAFREEIKGALRCVDFKSRYLFRQFHYQVAAALKGLAHFFYRSLSACIGSFGSFLRYGARAGSILSLQFVDSLYNPFRCGDEADAPSRHGISFRHAVYDYHTVFYLGKLCDALVAAYVVDVFVDFVGYHNHALMLCQYAGQALQFFFRIYRTSRVGGRAQYQCTGVWRDGGFELCRGNLEILFDACTHDDGSSFGQLYHFGIAYPIGGGNDNLVALVDECHDGIAD